MLMLLHRQLHKKYPECSTALYSCCRGFQFNHVGGGTKTRRPITLHMKYNKDATQPCCYLMTEDNGEQEVTLEELQVRWQQCLLGMTCWATRVGSGRLNQGPSNIVVKLQFNNSLHCHRGCTLSQGLLCCCSMHSIVAASVQQEHIHHENRRLEEEQQFWSKEIVVRIEYKYSPNLTIIDTPGLISAAPGKKNTALQTAAKQVEAMVTQKMMQQVRRSTAVASWLGHCFCLC